MKKIFKKVIGVFLLMLIGTVCFAQKSYIVLEGGATDGTDLSSRLKNYGDYEIESVNIYSCQSSSTSPLRARYVVILSKSSNVSLKIDTILGGDDDTDVYEIARYDLQGRPVDEKAKGLQIIVYSNYTTKTVFIE